MFFQRCIYLLIIFVFAYSCHAKINQYKSLPNQTKIRNGFWIEKYTKSESEILTIKGRYKNGEKKGTWKIFSNDILYQKEIFKGNISKITSYFPNGKVMEKGHTKIDRTKDGVHWYYFGDWNYYDTEGQIIYIKRYENGKFDSISLKE